MTSTITQNSSFPQNAVLQNTLPQNNFSQNTFPQNLQNPQNTFQQNTFPQNTFSSYPHGNRLHRLRNSPYPQIPRYSPYPQIPRYSPYQHQHHHSSARQAQEHSSPSPSSLSAFSASFPLGTLPPSFNRSHLIDEIPVTYYLDKLHLLGPTFYNDKQTAHAELRINSLPNTIFYVHKEYLTLQSIFFRQVFERVKNGNCIKITLPAPETFQPILEYLYTGDDDKWYKTMTIENWSNINKNVQFLGLYPEAKDVCMNFYKNHKNEIDQTGTENVCVTEGGVVTTS